MKNIEMVTVNFKVPADLISRIEALSSSLGIKRSSCFRLLLVRGLVSWGF